MAASRMSRIASCRLVLWSLMMATTLAQVSSDMVPQENFEDVELITVPRVGDEFVAIAGAEGDDKLSTSPSDLKKNVLNKKFQKFFPKTESEWNFKGEGKKTDVFIKDPKDNRLLRIISEGLLSPKDVLPIVSNDAIISSQKNGSEMSVTVQTEGMTGVVNDDIAVDSDEKIIIEKKKNATKERTFVKIENDASTESEENVKINLDANAGVQSPFFNKQKGTIAVPVQKQISLSKSKENQSYKKPNENKGYDVIPLNKQKEKETIDEGVFDFVDSPLSDKHLVPAGTAQTSRINVKKGPNGQDYEYEYIYYYYEDPDEITGHNNGEKLQKGNEIPISTSGSTPRSTTSNTKIPSTSPPRFTKPTNDNALGSRIKSTDILNEGVSSQPQQHNRDKQRNEFKYAANTPATHSQQPPSAIPNNNVVSNEVYWQYDSSRFPGRQVQHQAVSQQPLQTVTDETIQTTKHPSRGRTHYNTITTDDSSFIVTALPISTQQPRETQTRNKSTPGAVRQPGLELVDSNSFRTHSTSVPINYENAYSPVQTFDTLRGKSLKQSTQDFITASQNLPSAMSSTRSETFKKESTSEYVTGTERSLPTSPSRNITPLSTDITADNTVPFSTLPESTLTTVYGAGLTDKAAHDLYAIYQQTQNEETVKNTIAQDDRTTIVDEPLNTYIHTIQPITSIFTTIPTTTSTTTTTTPAPTTTSTTTTTVSSIATGRIRFRGNGAHTHRSKLSPSSTETTPILSDTTDESTEKTRNRFRPSHQREHGNNRISAYGRRGFSSTTAASADGELSSNPPISQETSSKSSWLPSPRTRYRSSSIRPESPSDDNQSTTSSNSRLNFDRYNSRRRQGLRTTSTLAPTEDDIKQDAGVAETAALDQQSTTYRSIRNRINLNNPGRTNGLRPGAKLNLSLRGKGSSTTTTVPIPLDADTSGSADIPVEQKQTEEHSDQEQVINDTTLNSTPSTSTFSTPYPDPLTRLKNRPKIHMPEKGSHAKAQAQQFNNAAILNQNRRNLVHNLLPRKKQLSTSTEVQELKEEKSEIAPRPVTEEPTDEAVPKTDIELSENQPVEISSTTENKLSSRLTSRRRNFAGRKPGTLVNFNRQNPNEES